MTTPRTYAVRAAALLALAAGGVGCSGEDGSDPSGPSGSSSGSSLSMADLPSVPPVAESESWDQADGQFLVMMVPHHRQALDMVELAATRATDPGLRAVADRIRAAQGPEILVMADWLVDHGIDVPAGEMGPMTMTGMLSPTQMEELAAADGAEFDRLFLAGMVQHHEGAIAMADDELRDGEDVRILELATDIKAGQTVEIERMRSLLAG